VAEPIIDILSIEDKHWSFSKSLPHREKIMDTANVKGSQVRVRVRQRNQEPEK
jgi:hypothetical protein